MVVKELVAKLGLDIDGSAFGMADKAIEGLKSNFLKVGLVVGGFATALGAAIGSTARAAGEINDLRARTGESASALQELRYAAEQVGVPFEGLIQGMTLMTRNAREAAMGSKEAAGAFHQIGINPKAFKSSSEMLGAVADKIAALKRSGQDMKATAVAMDIFGRSGSQLIPLLAEGSAGIDRMRKRAQMLGGVMSDDLVAKGDQFGDTLVDLQWALAGVRNMLAEAFMGPLQWLIDKWAEWIGANRGLVVGLIQFVGAGLGLWAVYAAGIAVTGVLQRLSWGAAMLIGKLWPLLGQLPALWLELKATGAAFRENARAAFLTSFSFKGLAQSIWGAIRAFGAWLLTQAKAGWTALVAGISSARTAFVGLNAQMVMANIQAIRLRVNALLAWLGLTWPIIAVIALIAMLIIAIQDLWVAIQGGPSIFGSIFDGLKWAAVESIEWVKAKFTAFMDWIRAVPGRIAQWFKGLNPLASAGDFGATFGGGASVGSSIANSPTGGGVAVASNEFRSQIVINARPGQSPSSIASEAVDREADFFTTRLQEAQAAG